MRGFALLTVAVVGVGVSAAWVSGQSPVNTMPGTPVGSPSVQPVGTRLPSVGQKVGTPPAGFNSKAISPFAGENWPKADANLVVAPYPTPGGTPDSFWDKLYKRWLVLFADDKQPTPTYTPGIARRNHQRREKQHEEMAKRMRD